MRRKYKPVPKDIIPAEVTRLSHDGRGVATIGGKTTFVRDALPGEEILLQYTANHSKYNEAQAMEIVKPSPHRVKPACEHTFFCGACSLHHLSHEQQLLHKQNTLLEHLQHIGLTQPEAISPPLFGKPTYYRRKARLSSHYVNMKEKLLIGFHEKNGRFVADIEHCPILHDSVSSIHEELRQFIFSLSCYKEIPQIEIAAGDTRTALVLRHLSPFTAEDKIKIIDFATAHSFDIYFQPSSTASIHKFWPEDNAEYLTYGLLNNQIQIYFHPNDFVQVNAEVNRKMVERAIELLEPQPGEKILDLFCGLGNFSLPMATRAALVVGVEGDDGMVNKAKFNAQQNQIQNTEFHCADLTDLTKLQATWTSQQFDKIILDPPRCGAEGIVKHIERFNAKRILYISCDPATLARDTQILIQKGYTLAQAGIIDMFTHTKHVESIALFERNLK